MMFGKPRVVWMPLTSTHFFKYLMCWIMFEYTVSNDRKIADVTSLTPLTITKATTLQCFTVFQHYVLLDGHVLRLLVVFVGFCSSDSSLTADVSSSKTYLVFQSDRTEGKCRFICALFSIFRIWGVWFVLTKSPEVCFFSMSLLLYFTLIFHSHTL